MGNLYRSGDNWQAHLRHIAWGSIYRGANSLARHYAEEYGLDDVQREYVWALQVTKRGYGNQEMPQDWLSYMQSKVREAIEAGRQRPGGHGLPADVAALFPFEFAD